MTELSPSEFAKIVIALGSQKNGAEWLEYYKNLMKVLNEAPSNS